MNGILLLFQHLITKTSAVKGQENNVRCRPIYYDKVKTRKNRNFHILNNLCHRSYIDFLIIPGVLVYTTTPAEPMCFATQSNVDIRVYKMY